MENDLIRVVDALPGLVWTALPDGRADFLNARWCHYTGLRREAAYGYAWLEAVHPEDVSALLERWQAALESGEAREIEARIRRFDGEYRWFSFNASPIFDACGTLVRWCGINTDIEDRRRAERAGRESDRRFELIVDGLPAVVTLMTADGELERANRHMIDYFGKTLEELKSRPVGYSFHPDDRLEVLARWRHSVATGESYDFEARLRGADGVYRWFHSRGFPLRDADGRIALWYILQTDIDDRKRAEMLLQGEKELIEMVARGRAIADILESLCELAQKAAGGCYCSVVVVDSSGARIVQAVAPSLSARFLGAIADVPLRERASPCALAAAANEQVIISDLCLETRWPNEWWSIASATGLRACWSTPFSSTAGDVLGAITLYYDEPKSPDALHQSLIDRFAHIASVAVERSRSDTKLKRNEAFLAEAQRLSRTGSWAWRIATGEMIWSRQTYRIFEIDPRSTITPELIASRVHPDDLPIFHEMMSRAQDGAGSFSYEHRLLMSDGSVKHLQIVARITRDAADQVECIGAVLDVTERRHAEEALGKVRSELAHVARVSSLGALTASIAHEVSQPLSGIITNAGTCLRMLAAAPPDIEGARETVARTIRDGKRAVEIIARLRALFAKKEPTVEPVDVSALTREVLALSRAELQRGRVIVQTELDDHLPLVSGDRVQLQQVVLNLLLNASEAMSAVSGGARELVVRSAIDDAGDVFVEVCDSGPGIDPDDLDRLFSSFYTTKPDGMGMGLSISRSIVEAHGGRLTARHNDAHGAAFRFTLPAPTAI
jgi:PAS domain S-box-containing protein